MGRNIVSPDAGVVVKSIRFPLIEQHIHSCLCGHWISRDIIFFETIFRHDASCGYGVQLVMNEAGTQQIESFPIRDSSSS